MRSATEMVVQTITDPVATEVGMDGEARAEVERLFRTQISPLRLFPGATLAVYHRGRLALDITDGYADSQRGHQVCSQTLFPLFSGTKPFASIALLQQIERGRA